MVEILGTGGVFAFVKLEEEIHPVVDPAEDRSALE